MDIYLSNESPNNLQIIINSISINTFIYKHKLDDDISMTPHPNTTETATIHENEGEVEEIPTIPSIPPPNINQNNNKHNASKTIPLSDTIMTYLLIGSSSCVCCLCIIALCLTSRHARLRKRQRNAQKQNGTTSPNHENNSTSTSNSNINNDELDKLTMKENGDHKCSIPMDHNHKNNPHGPCPSGNSNSNGNDNKYKYQPHLTVDDKSVLLKQVQEKEIVS